MRHLDDVALSALSRREPEAVAYFAEHLSRPCDTCEAFLAAHRAGPARRAGGRAAAGLAPPAASAPPWMKWVWR
ncbi:hypothetical protein ACLEPN_21520, partial [Myxococcus sp. 1LA]